MLVYDITNDKSFENIKNWIRNIEEVSNLNLGHNMFRVAIMQQNESVALCGREVALTCILIIAKCFRTVK